MNRPEKPKSPKPYALVSLPKDAPDRQKTIGHHQLKKDRLQGSLSLRLNIKSSSFIASGVVAMGSNLSSQTRKIPLIKLAVESNNQLVIPGSSLKGTIRSTYEAITRSCLCKTKADKNAIPKNYQPCDKDKKNQKFCPACQVFGAMGWQGLLSFQDAILTATPEQTITPGFMPSLYSPSPKRSGYDEKGKVAGRKFYYHAKEVIEKTESQGIPIQNIKQDSIFTTKINFRNLSKAELGTLFTVLGQNTNHPFALKIGGGKPIGMGSLITKIIEIDCPNVRDRYLSYNTDSDPLTGEPLETFIKEAIQKAHKSQLIQRQQLEELQNILTYPTNREAPLEMY